MKKEGKVLMMVGIAIIIGSSGILIPIDKGRCENKVTIKDELAVQLVCAKLAVLAGTGGYSCMAHALVNEDSLDYDIFVKSLEPVENSFVPVVLGLTGTLVDETDCRARWLYIIHGVRLCRISIKDTQRISEEITAGTYDKPVLRQHIAEAIEWIFKY